MSKARLVITVVVTEGRIPAEVAATYGLSRSWVYELVARYRAEGAAAFEPRSGRPKASPRAIPHATVSLIADLRKDLAGQGLDAGPATIAWHLEHHHHLRQARQHNRASHRPLPAAVESPEEPALAIGYGLILPPPQNGSPWHRKPGLQPIGADDELASRRDARKPEAAAPWALPPGARPPAPPGGGRRPPRPRRPWDPPAGPGGQQ
jgi:leucine-zipper of insertion element IS481